MAVTAKMNAGHIEPMPNAENPTAKRIKFYCVWDQDPASPNFEWSMATPSGSAELVITNPAAFEQFETGKSYLVTFREVD